MAFSRNAIELPGWLMFSVTVLAAELVGSFSENLSFLKNRWEPYISKIIEVKIYLNEGKILKTYFFYILGSSHRKALLWTSSIFKTQWNRFFIGNKHDINPQPFLKKTCHGKRQKKDWAEKQCHFCINGVAQKYPKSLFQNHTLQNLQHERGFLDIGITCRPIAFSVFLEILFLSIVISIFQAKKMIAQPVENWKWTHIINKC